MGGDWGDDGAARDEHDHEGVRRRVVYERFDGRPGADFTGYDEQEDCRRQTWVDDAGN